MQRPFNFFSTFFLSSSFSSTWCYWLVVCLDLQSPLIISILFFSCALFFTYGLVHLRSFSSFLFVAVASFCILSFVCANRYMYHSNIKSFPFLLFENGQRAHLEYVRSFSIFCVCVCVCFCLLLFFKCCGILSFLVVFEAEMSTNEKQFLMNDANKQKGNSTCFPCLVPSKLSIHSIPNYALLLIFFFSLFVFSVDRMLAFSFILLLTCFARVQDFAIWFSR